MTPGNSRRFTFPPELHELEKGGMKEIWRHDESSIAR
jgi:hypothetical protein